MKHTITFYNNKDHQIYKPHVIEPHDYKFDFYPSDKRCYFRQEILVKDSKHNLIPFVICALSKVTAINREATHGISSVHLCKDPKKSFNECEEKDNMNNKRLIWERKLQLEEFEKKQVYEPNLKVLIDSFNDSKNN